MVSIQPSAPNSFFSWSPRFVAPYVALRNAALVKTKESVELLRSSDLMALLDSEDWFKNNLRMAPRQLAQLRGCGGTISAITGGIRKSMEAGAAGHLLAKNCSFDVIN